MAIDSLDLYLQKTFLAKKGFLCGSAVGREISPSPQKKLISSLSLLTNQQTSGCTKLTFCCRSKGKEVPHCGRGWQRGLFQTVIISSGLNMHVINFPLGTKWLAVQLQCREIICQVLNFLGLENSSVWYKQKRYLHRLLNSNAHLG